MNLIKKVALFAIIPLSMTNCSVNLRLIGNRNLEKSELILGIDNRNNLSNLSNYELMEYWDTKFKNSIYSSNLGYDSDGDGIINADEPFGWKYRYGPFIDSNRNGVVDMFDWQIDGFDSAYISNYPYRINERWIGLNLNPFWFNEYVYRYNNYFKIHRRYRHQEKKYWNMHTIRNNKKRSNYNTRARNIKYKRRTNSTKYNPIRIKSSRISSLREKRNFKKRVKKNKSFPIIRKSQIKRHKIGRSSNSKRNTNN